MQEAGPPERSGEALKHPPPSEVQAEAAVDAPGIRSTVERFVYAVDRTDRGVTGHVGLPVAIEAFHALGLAEACRRELVLKKRQRGLSELYHALATVALPQAWRSERLSTARFRWLKRAGRVIRHAGRHVVVLSHLAAGLLTVCLAARVALARVATG